MERELRRWALRGAAAALLSLLPGLVLAQQAGGEPEMREEHTVSIMVIRPAQAGLQLEPRLAELTAPLPGSALLAPDLSRERNDAMLNGALILVGALGVFDNVVVHWILGWHRAIEDHPHTLEIEIGIVAVNTALLATGLWREYRARQR